MPIKVCPACGAAYSKPAYRVDSFKIVKCKSCGLVYLQNPPDSDDLYEQYYDRTYQDPANYRSGSPDLHLAEQWSINDQRLRALKQFKSGGRLLDIGCGYGYFLKSAVAAGYDVFGIDISKKAVEYAVNFLNVSAIVSTIDELKDKAAQKFQIITLWHVLEHYIDPYQTLQSVRNLLAQDGICIIEVPNLKSLKFMLSINKWHGGNHPLYHRIFFTASTLSRSLKESGFSDVSRLDLSYSIPGRNFIFELIKKGLNRIACDAFLAFAARK
jgi:SAM-dependent methyltransferase